MWDLASVKLIGHTHLTPLDCEADLKARPSCVYREESLIAKSIKITLSRLQQTMMFVCF
jgi:hypothetical protein